jgi:hypothetical protein
MIWVALAILIYTEKQILKAYGLTIHYKNHKEDILTMVLIKHINFKGVLTMKILISKYNSNENSVVDSIIFSGSYKEAEEFVNIKNSKLKSGKFYWTVSQINI